MAEGNKKRPSTRSSASSAMAETLYGGAQGVSNQGQQEQDAQQPEIGTANESPALPDDSAETQQHGGYADNQPLDAETAKEYDVAPGTTWRIVHIGQKLGTLWRAVGAGTATRAQVLSFRHQLAALRAAPDLSPRELQEARTFAGIYLSLANGTGQFKPGEIVGDPYFAEQALGTPTGGGAGRLPGAPFGARMNMLRPDSSPLPTLNQQMGLSLPRSPIPRNLPPPPAPPAKRRQ